MKLKKILAMTMVAAMVVTMASGCGAKKTNEVDASKTTLYVGNFAGGIGDTWLKTAISKFEEKYADVSFEEGKKGVQILIGSNDKTSMVGTELVKLVSSSTNDVFFTESVYYYEWVSKGLMYEITDMIDGSLEEFGDTGSISDKMEKDVREALAVDGKVYALPFWEGYYGMTYNATLFDEKGWYIAEDGSYTNASGKLSAGPDGKMGTYDDGLPATYEQFFQLLERIAKDNVTPFQWAGASPDYMTWFLGALFADYEGYDDLMLNYNLEGTTQLVKPGSVNKDNLTYETETVTITKENGYELARQEGYLHALNFAQTLLRGKGYYDVNTCLSGAYKQQDAQLAFVRNATTTSNKPVAILLDGSWWENEASNAYRETYGSNGTKFDNEMEFKWMPLPKATEAQIGSENILISPLDSYCFINANIDASKVEVAKKFLAFCHTDAQLAEFTEMTGIVKPYNYEVNTEKLTPFAKSLVEASANSRVVFPKSNNAVYRFAAQDLRLAELFTSRYDSQQNVSIQVATALAAKDGTNYKYDFMDWFDGILIDRTALWTALDKVIH